ncbi:DUF2156 domain-containing protein, partial [Methanocalculus sp.]|uniref:DUF2156 domain-containing protein n=1 Tax=Methanocalculus sp. TaxID=2004547 RepID=UPI0027254290
YLSRDLANLPGKNYLTIRGQINKFKRSITYSVEQITEDSIEDIKEFLERWCEWKHCDKFPILAHEKEAVIFAVDHFDELNCQGLFIRTGNDISAIAIWGIMNEETIVVHFEKALPGFEGIYKIINMKTAKAVQTRYRYINRESDMGVPGLREAKIRYHPHHMAPVWYIKKIDMDSRKEVFL